MTSNLEHFGQKLQRLPAGNDDNERTLLLEFLEKTTDISPDERLSDFLKSVMSNAPYLRDGLLSQAKFIEAAFSTSIDETIERLIEAAASVWQTASSESEVMRALRELKNKVALLLALADLGKVLTFEDVTKALSDFADAALLSAVRFSLIEEEKRGKISLKNSDKPEQSSLSLIHI